ncbi:YkvA family protein [candidate division CSSED10-310 bacterium]|uniref:YkvA family protein n=1 Tax=candidate division CSSED10-310 bacterium TaxID=2855610 RepID=A0ABV6YX95_UNCC1
MFDVVDTIKDKIQNSKDSIINHFQKKAAVDKSQASRNVGQRAFEFLKAFPYLVLLVSKITLDSRIPKKIRIFAGALIAYVISPVDFLPELFTGPIGFIDDLFVVVLGLRLILKHVDANIIREHWKGDQDILVLLQDILSYADVLLPAKILSKINEWLQEKGGELMVVDQDQT